VTLRHRLHRVLYVPLDDRPYNLKAPRLLAQMVDYEMVVPPTETLGRFRTPGQPDEIANWLRAHAGSNIDCVLLSLDMLAYGGLWASRSSGTRTQLAHERLAILKELREISPETPIYAYSILMRLGSITTSDSAAQHLESLVHYSVLAGEAEDSGDPEIAKQLSALERQIPPAVLGEYMAVRRRNHEVNLALAQQVADETLDFLVYSQDTASPQGLHRTEQGELEAACEALRVGDRVQFQTGADQIGMCMFARFVHAHMGKAPCVRVFMSPGAGDQAIPPAEDRTVTESLRRHLALIGAREATDADEQPDMLLAVNAPAPHDRSALHDPDTARAHREQARQFVGEAMDARKGRGLAVCDIAFPNGADDIFVQELISATTNLAALLTYAGWNSASNSIGSALAHGTLRLISLQDKGAFDLVRLVGDMSPMRYLSLLDSLIASEKAHIRFLMQRTADDWLYQARVRPRILDHICNGLRSGLFDLASGYRQAEALMRDELTQAVTDLWIDQLLGRQCVSIGSDLAGDEQTALVLADLEETRLSLPWRRLFEIDMELEFGVQLVAAGDAEDE